MNNSLKKQLFYYLKYRSGVKIAKGDFERMEFKRPNGKRYTVENVLRRLRELTEAEHSPIKKEEQGETGHVFYWYQEPPMGKIVEINGQVVYQPPQQTLM